MNKQFTSTEVFCITLMVLLHSATFVALVVMGLEIATL